jgi:RNA polymerase-binding transcription factor DksA
LANVVEILLKARDDASKAIGKTSTSIDRLSERAKKARVPLMLMTGALVAGAISAAKAASDLEEAVNKATVTFGEASDVVTDFAETSSTKFAVSRRAAHEYAGTLGMILNASGLASDASADMSVELIKLAADLSSFNNIPIDVALQKLRSGLVGEVEPLRTVGILLSQVAVEAKAVELGLVSQGGVMSEAAKVQARYALIMEATITVQGDMERTGESLENQTKKLQSAMEDLRGELGTELLPAFTLVISSLRTTTELLADMPDPAKKAAVGLTAVAIAIGAIGLALPPVIAGLGFVAGAFSVVGASVVVMAAALGGLIVIAVAVKNNINDVSGALDGLWLTIKRNPLDFSITLDSWRDSMLGVRDSVDTTVQSLDVWLEDLGLAETALISVEQSAKDAEEAGKRLADWVSSNLADIKIAGIEEEITGGEILQAYADLQERIRGYDKETADAAEVLRQEGIDAVMDALEKERQARRKLFNETVAKTRAARAEEKRLADEAHRHLVFLVEERTRIAERAAKAKADAEIEALRRIQAFRFGSQFGDVQKKAMSDLRNIITGVGVAAPEGIGVELTKMGFDTTALTKMLELSATRSGRSIEQEAKTFIDKLEINFSGIATDDPFALAKAIAEALDEMIGSGALRNEQVKSQ